MQFDFFATKARGLKEAQSLVVWCLRSCLRFSLKPLEVVKSPLYYSSYNVSVPTFPLFQRGSEESALIIQHHKGDFQTLHFFRQNPQQFLSLCGENINRLITERLQ